MKKFSTIVACALIAFAGYELAHTDYLSTNTISAEPSHPITSFTVPTIKPDTVKIKERDTVTVEKEVQTIKYRTKPVVRTVHRVDTVEVPVLYTRTGGKRKEISPDTLLDKRHPRVTKKVIELDG